jgi:hypothetical protein
MVNLAQSTPSRRAAGSPQSKKTTVMLGCVDKPNPDPDGRKNDKGREALDEFVVASCDAP